MTSRSDAAAARAADRRPRGQGLRSFLVEHAPLKRAVKLHEDFYNSLTPRPARREIIAFYAAMYAQKSGRDLAWAWDLEREEIEMRERSLKMREGRVASAEQLRELEQQQKKLQRDLKRSRHNMKVLRDKYPDDP